MALKRMDNAGIVVDDLGGTIDFFCELGLEIEGRATIEGEWAGRVTGLGDQRVDIAMMRTPDGHGRLELSRFLTPPAVADHEDGHPRSSVRTRGGERFCPPRGYRRPPRRRWRPRCRAPICRGLASEETPVREPSAEFA